MRGSKFVCVVSLTWLMASGCGLSQRRTPSPEPTGSGASGGVGVGASGESTGASGGTGGTASAGGSGGIGAGAVAGSAGLGEEPEPSCKLHVDPERGLATNDGSSWSRALGTLQAALSSATSGCEIWLKTGTYWPGTTRNDTFDLPDGVTLRGGFAGSEARARERDSANTSVLSGELGDETTLEDNSFRVVTALGDATLERIQVTGGNAESGDGGGIAALGHLTLNACRIFGNEAYQGGGLHAAAGLTAADSSFENNRGHHGGAVSALGPEPVQLTGCSFLQNHAEYGAGIHASGSLVTVTGTAFYENAAGSYAGAIYVDGTGSLRVMGSLFELGTASRGGAAIYASGSLELEGTTFVENVTSGGGTVVALAGLTAKDSSFQLNSGSPIEVPATPIACSVTIVSASFQENVGQGAGALALSGCDATIEDSTFWANRGGSGAISYLTPGGSLDVLSSTFGENETSSFGGAIGTSSIAFLRIAESHFKSNLALSGGAIAVDGRSPLELERCVFEANQATLGGAVWHLADTLTLTDSIFYANEAEEGSAVYDGSGVTATYTNVTVVNNVASSGAALYHEGPLALRNSIFWGNTPAHVLVNAFTPDPAPLELDSTNLDGDYPNLVAFDPRFVALERGDLHLAAGSPCIDAANDALASDQDCGGNARVDEPGVPACEADAPTCGSVADMGALEFRPGD